MVNLHYGDDHSSVAGSPDSTTIQVLPYSTTIQVQRYIDLITPYKYFHRITFTLANIDSSEHIKNLRLVIS